MDEEIIWSLLVVGVAIGLFGWTIYWAGLSAIGGFCGAVVGGAIAVAVGVFLELGDGASMVALAVTAIVGAVGGVVLIRLVEHFFFFIVGAALGAPLAWVAVTEPPLANMGWAQTDLAKFGALLAGAFGGGFGMLRFHRYVVALVAAIVGGSLVAMSLPIESRLLMGTCFVALSMAAQTGLIRKFLPGDRLPRRSGAKKKSPKPEKEE